MHYDYESAARNLYTITAPSQSYDIFEVRRVGYKSATGVIFPVQQDDYLAPSTQFCYDRDGVACDVAGVWAASHA